MANGKLSKMHKRVRSGELTSRDSNQRLFRKKDLINEIKEKSENGGYDDEKSKVKGEKHGLCNVTSCKSPNDVVYENVWMRHAGKKFYCLKCAIDMTKLDKSDARVKDPEACHWDGRFPDMMSTPELMSMGFDCRYLLVVNEDKTHFQLHVDPIKYSGIRVVVGEMVAVPKDIEFDADEKPECVVEFEGEEFELFNLQDPLTLASIPAKLDHICLSGFDWCDMYTFAVKKEEVLTPFNGQIEVRNYENVEFEIYSDGKWMLLDETYLEVQLENMSKFTSKVNAKLNKLHQQDEESL